MAITQEHVTGGSVAVVLSTNLPPVLTWLQTHQGPPPVQEETAILIALGAAAVYLVAKGVSAFSAWRAARAAPKTA